MSNLEIPKKLQFSFLKELLLYILFAFSSYNIFGLTIAFFALNFLFISAATLFSVFSYKKTSKLNKSIDILNRMQRILLIPRFEYDGCSLIIRDIVPNRDLMDEIRELKKGKK
jgi:hypothetical protein